MIPAIPLHIEVNQTKYGLEWAITADGYPKFTCETLEPLISFGVPIDWISDLESELAAHIDPWHERNATDYPVCLYDEYYIRAGELDWDVETSA